MKADDIRGMSNRLFVIVRAAVVAAAFVSIWTWFVPRWFAASRGVTLSLRFDPAASVLMLIGGAIMLKCVWDFAWRGRGTPAPFDPPRRLVVSGFYRWVRNPMYLGMGTFLIGEALMLRPIAREMLTLCAVLWVVVTIFVMVYEEPTLRELFGEEYREYCRNVRRWIPRMTPWYPPPHLE
jgi:protein-S-isoprenylcysteine O-methyltransferase Ste14